MGITSPSNGSARSNWIRPFVMVTGWNEWTAGKWSRPGLPVVFVDQFDQEFSRNKEPVSGLHWDNPQKPGEIMDVYLSGDAAPDGRFNYRYQLGMAETQAVKTDE